MTRTLLYLSIIVLCGSCLKEELPVPAYDRGDARTATLCMGAAYEDQLWMDLGSASVVTINQKTEWDLAFESAADGWRVWLNGSRLMTAWDIGGVDLSEAVDTVGMYAGRRIDAPSGVPDSTAIGDWRDSNKVFVIDLGYTALGQWQGTVKVRFDAVSGDSFAFQVAQQDGSGLRTVALPKDATRDLTYFSFDQGPVLIEPPSSSWDLVFTQYTHQFYDPYLPYIVTGVLASPRTRVAEVRDKEFSDLTLSDTLSFPFSRHRDAVGYLWKTYSFETSSYTIDNSLAYIIEDAEGFFHKLRFLDFYSSQGQVGCPSFEVETL